MDPRRVVTGLNCRSLRLIVLGFLIAGSTFAAPGDLVLILGDSIKRSWKQIIYFNSEAKGEEGAQKTTVAIDLPETEGFSFDDDIEIISDERGVRIAREEGD